MTALLMALSSSVSRSGGATLGGARRVVVGSRVDSLSSEGWFVDRFAHRGMSGFRPGIDGFRPRWRDTEWVTGRQQAVDVVVAALVGAGCSLEVWGPSGFGSTRMTGPRAAVFAAYMLAVLSLAFRRRAPLASALVLVAQCRLRALRARRGRHDHRAGACSGVRNVDQLSNSEL
jgi:hypothetical protein